MNEIYKLQLLLKIWFLDYNINPRGKSILTKLSNTIKSRDNQVLTSKLNIINTSHIPLLKALGDYYYTLYDKSRAQMSFRVGSPEYLEQNFKDIYPDVRKAIYEFSIGTNTNPLATEISKSKFTFSNNAEKQIQEFVVMHMTKLMKSRNAKIDKYEYDTKNCGTTTGFYLSRKTSQQTADICKIQDKIRKRVIQYIVASVSYPINYPPITPIDLSSIDKNTCSKFMVYMQHYAKRAYMEHDGKTANGFMNLKYNRALLKTKKPETYTELYIESLNRIKTDLSQIVINELTKYMGNRYFSDKYKVKLLSKENGTEITVKDLEKEIIELVKVQDLSCNADKDLVGELEKKLTTESFKIKSMDINISKRTESPAQSASNGVPTKPDSSNTTTLVTNQ